MRRVKVEARDIRVGISGSGTHCPVALALGRALPEWRGEMVVGSRRIDFWDGATLARSVDAPPEVADFVKRFDAGAEELDPFEFDLEMVDKE